MAAVLLKATQAVQAAEPVALFHVPMALKSQTEDMSHKEGKLKFGG